MVVSIRALSFHHQQSSCMLSGIEASCLSVSYILLIMLYSGLFFASSSSFYGSPG